MGLILGRSVAASRGIGFSQRQHQQSGELVTYAGDGHLISFAPARSFAAELIERPADERDRFWSDWSETMLAGTTAWLLADQPPSERRLSRLFNV